MIVTFIHHSSFVAELEKTILIFDYYPEGKTHTLRELTGGADTGKRIYVFASHRHGDHYSPAIFSWLKEREDITYVLSDDIWVRGGRLSRLGVPEERAGQVHSIGPDETARIDDLTVETLPSTDEGVAFLITAEEKVIYHAGDLHWWYWEERGAAYVKKWGELYTRELDKIVGRHIDVAFVLLDPRMGAGYGKGMEEFFRRVGADVVFPDHMWGDFGLIEKFKASAEGKPYADRIVTITGEGERFSIDESPGI